MEIVDARKYTVIHRNGERNALGQFIKGGKFSKAHRNAMSRGSKGKKLTAEHCLNIAKTKIGDKTRRMVKPGLKVGAVGNVSV